MADTATAYKTEYRKLYVANTQLQNEHTQLQKEHTQLQKNYDSTLKILRGLTHDQTKLQQHISNWGIKMIKERFLFLHPIRIP